MRDSLHGRTHGLRNRGPFAFTPWIRSPDCHINLIINVENKHDKYKPTVIDQPGQHSTQATEQVNNSIMMYVKEY